MKSMHRVGLVRHALCLAVLLSLGACMNDDDPSEQPTGPATVAVSGVATKGQLKAAIVRAFRVNADGSTTLLKESITDTIGGYELTGIPAGEVILVEVSAGPNTRMVDEASNDSNVPLPAGFKLRAAVVTQSGGSNTVQITPFSEMAVSKAQAQGGLTAGNVEGANADIRTYLGFDVISEKPEFTDDGTTPANKAALMLAAISEVAHDTTTLGALGCGSAADTGAKVQCVVEKMAERGSQDATLAQTIGDAKDTVASGDYAGTEVPPKPVPQPSAITSPAEGATAVADAKALVANLRSNYAALYGSSGDTLYKRLAAVQQSFLAMPELLSTSHRGLLQVAVDASARLDAVIDGEITGDLPEANHIFRPLNGNVLNVGCSFFQNAAFTLPATTYDHSRYVACRVSQAVVQAGSGHEVVQHRLLILPVAGSPHAYQLRSQVVRQAVEMSNGQWVLAGNTTQELTGYKLASLTLTRHGGETLDASVRGQFAPAIQQSTGSHDTGALSVEVDALRSPSVGGAARLTLAGTLQRLDANEAVIGSVTLGANSFVQGITPPAGQADAAIDHSQTEARLVLQAQTAGGQQVVGTLVLRGFETDLQGIATPGYAEFEGRIVDGAGTVLFNGKLDSLRTNMAAYDSAEPDSATNHVSRTVSLTGDLFVPASALLTVNLSLSELAYRDYAATGSYQQAGMQVNLSLTGAGTAPGQLAGLTLSSSTGVSITLEPGTAVFPIKKADVVVGRLDAQQRQIYYRDNTSESF